MSQSIAEFHAQRALIQQHLDWLDAQIKRAESTTETGQQCTNQSSIDDSTTTIVAAAAATSPPVETADASQTMHIEPIAEVDKMWRAGTNSLDLKHVQFGCITLFVITTLLFLFLLFGLPYLVD